MLKEIENILISDLKNDWGIGFILYLHPNFDVKLLDIRYGQLTPKRLLELAPAFLTQDAFYGSTENQKINYTLKAITDISEMKAQGKLIFKHN